MLCSKWRDFTQLPWGHSCYKYFLFGGSEIRSLAWEVRHFSRVRWTCPRSGHNWHWLPMACFTTCQSVATGTLLLGLGGLGDCHDGTWKSLWSCCVSNLLGTTFVAASYACSLGTLTNPCEGLINGCNTKTKSHFFWLCYQVFLLYQPSMSICSCKVKGRAATKWPHARKRMQVTEVQNSAIQCGVCDSNFQFDSWWAMFLVRRDCVSCFSSHNITPQLRVI